MTMRSLLIWIFSGLTLTTAHAQGRPRGLDSLEATLPHQPDSLRPHVMKALALGYRRVDSEKAREWAERDARESQRLHRAVDYAHALSVLGMLAKDQGKFEQAINYQLTALKIHERERSYVGILNVNNDIGILYKKMKLNDKALPFFQHEVTLCQHLLAQKTLAPKVRENYGVALAYALNNVGNCFLDQLDYAQAKPYFEQAVARGRALGVNDIGAVGYANLAAVETGQGHLPVALGYFHQSLALDRADENEFGQAETLASMAELYKKMHDDGQAERTLLVALTLGTRLHALPTLQQVQRELSQLYQRTGRYRLAAQHFDRLTGITDTLYNQNVTQKVADLETKYETEKKDAQNRLLQKQKQLQAAQLRTQQQVIRRRNVQLLAGLLVAGLLAGLAYLLYNRRRLRREVEFAQERQLLERLRTQAVLEAEETERRRIGADLHDGVGQLLTAAKLNLHALGEQLPAQTEGQQALLQNALDGVDESFKEVRSISHNLMPNALIKRGLAQAVRDFLDKLTPDGRLKINLEVVGLDRGRLEPTTENVLFRVIQELVQNVLKHARATEMTLQIVRHAEELTVLVEDNGVGFDPAALGEDAGIGLRNIESRMAFLGGRADFDAVLGRGTTVTLEVPLLAVVG